MKLANINSMRVCAFCQHWYDPSNSAIQPESNLFWRYDDRAKNMCLKKNLNMNATASCGKYECKI